MQRRKVLIIHDYSDGIKMVDSLVGDYLRELGYDVTVDMSENHPNTGSLVEFDVIFLSHNDFKRLYPHGRARNSDKYIVVNEVLPDTHIVVEDMKKGADSYISGGLVPRRYLEEIRISEE